MHYGKIFTETYRFIDIIKEYDMMYNKYTIADIQFKEEMEYNAEIIVNINFPEKYHLFIGEYLATAPPGITMAAIAHELGHMSTGNAILLGIYDRKNNDNSQEFKDKLNHYYKGAEFQADIFATRLLALAGYDPLLMANYVIGVSRKYHYDVDKDEDIHPSTNRRINTIMKACAKLF